MDLIYLALVIGFIALLLGIFLKIHVLVIVGIIALIIGAVLGVASLLGHPVGRRRTGI